MGADIHLFVEAKGGSPNHWRRLDRTVEMSDWRETTTLDLRWGQERNYDAFAMLANVRNGHGFAGIDTGEGFESIDMPRGLPDDVSDEVYSESARWGPDGHSHSWFTLRELLDLEESGYWDKTTTNRGMFMREALEDAKERGIVVSVEGNHAVLSEHPGAYAGAIHGPDEDDIFTLEYPVTYRDAAGWLVKNTIPAMVEIADSMALSRYLSEGVEGNGYPIVIKDRSEAMEHWVDAAELLRTTFWFDN